MGWVQIVLRAHSGPISTACCQPTGVSSKNTERDARLNAGICLTSYAQNTGGVVI